ncbi:TonB-dependent receptor [Teredinibacter waterburyi]|uniref:TonB-dependent receptor n=1 Tax=Teredinibacter waterburyi TaxID=1500538 RepID=UPI00165F604A|nr:TonB-dependent receptor [Teredinibacter waterburyi]
MLTPSRTALAIISVTILTSPLITSVVFASADESIQTPRSQSEALETVIVTADRAPSKRLALTTSVSLIDAEQIESVNAEHLQQLLQWSPGTWVSRGDGQEHLTAIRSPVFTGAGACGAFAMSEDGIALRAAGFCNVNQLFDSHFEAAQRLEVFRGPNSAVSGSNAVYGSIDIQLPDPLTAEQGKAKLDLGPNEFTRLTVSSPFSNSTDGARNWAQLTLTHSDSARAASGYDQVKFSLKNNVQLGDASVTNGISVSALDQQTAGYIMGADAYKDDSLRAGNVNPEAWRKASAMRVYSRWQWRNDDSVTELTPYLRANRMSFLMHFVPWQPEEDNAHQSLGLQFSHRVQLTETVKVSLGTELEKTHATLSEVQTEEAPFSPATFPVGRHYDYSVNANNAALSSGLDWQASPRLSTQLRLRWDYMAYDHSDHITSSICAPDVTNCRFYRLGDSRDSFQNASYRLGTQYSLTAKHSWFNSLSRGFRAPQASELYRLQQAPRAQLESVQLDAIETGLRGGGSRYFYEISLYAMVANNGIFQNSERVTLSGAKTSHQGVEWEFGLSLGPALSVRLNGSYARHKYRNAPDLLGLGDNSNIEGNDIDTAPKLMGAAVIAWQPNTGLKGELEYTNVSRYFLDPENSFSYPGHQLWNVNLQWLEMGPVQLQLRVNNLLDTRYAERADVNFGEERYFPGARRELNIGLSYAW